MRLKGVSVSSERSELAKRLVSWQASEKRAVYMATFQRETVAWRRAHRESFERTQVTPRGGASKGLAYRKGALA